MRLQRSKFHFIGIGGIGMCGLAKLLYNMGAQVTGSDLVENVNTENLKEMGVVVFKGHSSQNIQNPDVVVYSSAIDKTNPEIMEARAKEIPLIPRAEALAEIMRMKRGIAVAGTHGKTTTTSMTSAIFLEAQMSPTIVIGGRFDLIQSTSLLGHGEWLIAEADESDGSFHKLTPEIAIITNIDADHLDFFKTFENLQKSFLEFAQKVPFYGLNIVYGDDEETKKIFQHFHKKIVFYGFREDNDYVIRGQNGSYSLYKKNKNQLELLGDFNLKLPGRHNALNAAAAIIAGMSAGINFHTGALALENFEGVDRRFHYKGEKRNIKIYDDYGHHPTEIKAVLQAFKEKFPNNRLVVYFQPHRYSRTQHCWHDFTTAFFDADLLFLSDIYAAGESPIQGVSSQKLALEMKHNHCIYLSQKISDEIILKLQSGDIFVTLGAGDGWKLGMEILNKL